MPVEIPRNVADNMVFQTECEGQTESGAIHAHPAAPSNQLPGGVFRKWMYEAYVVRYSDNPERFLGLDDKPSCLAHAAVIDRDGAEELAEGGLVAVPVVQVLAELAGDQDHSRAGAAHLSGHLVGTNAGEFLAMLGHRANTVAGLPPCSGEDRDYHTIELRALLGTSWILRRRGGSGPLAYLDALGREFASQLPHAGVFDFEQAEEIARTRAATEEPVEPVLLFAIMNEQLGGSGQPTTTRDEEQPWVPPIHGMPVTTFLCVAMAFASAEAGPPRRDSEEILC